MLEKRIYLCDPSREHFCFENNKYIDGAPCMTHYAWAKMPDGCKWAFVSEYTLRSQKLQGCSKKVVMFVAKACQSCSENTLLFVHYLCMLQDVYKHTNCAWQNVQILDRPQTIVILSTTCVCYKTFTNILDHSQTIVIVSTTCVCYKMFTNLLDHSQTIVIVSTTCVLQNVHKHTRSFTNYCNTFHHLCVLQNVHKHTRSFTNHCNTVHHLCVCNKTFTPTRCRSFTNIALL